MELGGAAERTRFLDVLDAHLRRDALGVVVLRIDLDRFSRIRQVFGTAVAHMIRQGILERIEALAGGPQQVLTLAEDAFMAVVRMSSDAKAPETIGMRAVQAISAPIQLDGLPPIAVGSNAGVALASDFSVADPLRLMAGAELAVQRANAIGSRRVIVYQVEPVDDPTRLPELFADMLQAIEHGQFTPFLQVVVEPDTGNMAGAEALIRWQHPRHGLLLPGDFVGEAERSGLIRDIDALVWRQVWAFLASLPPEEQFDLSVNLSVADLDFPNLPDRVESLVSEIGVDPRRLVFEVTETAMSQDWPRARERLAAMRGLGCRIAIDDFGSGHMFLERLNTGLFDVLKLDRSITTAAAVEESGRDLLSGVVSLGHSLGMRVLAEGVETEAQQRVVCEVGCDLAQGYHFGKPTDPADFLASFIRSH